MKMVWWVFSKAEMKVGMKAGLLVYGDIDRIHLQTEQQSDSRSGTSLGSEQGTGV